jgi:integrase
LGTKNKRLAEIRARELDDQLSAGELKPAAAPETPEPIESAIIKFIESKRTESRARKTLVKYEGELRNFAKYAAEYHEVHLMPKLKIDHIDAYKAHRKKIDGLDSYTLYNHVIILKTWLNWCRRRGLIVINPLAEVPVSKPRRRRHPAATLEQVNAILERSSGESMAVFSTLAFTGLRIDELIVLRPQDVDLSAGFLHVCPRSEWRPKTESSQREVPLHPRLVTILVKKPKGKGGLFFNAPASLAFPNGDHHLNPRDVNEQFKSIAKACSFPVGRDNQGLTLHSCRRFFKTFAFDAGVPKPMVDAWMGHRDQSDMDAFYYNSAKSKEWMAKVPFGEPSEEEVKRAMSNHHRIGSQSR